MPKFSDAQRNFMEAALNHYFETVIKKLPTYAARAKYYELLWKECWDKLAEDTER